jgi:hypothetical protein
MPVLSDLILACASCVGVFVGNGPFVSRGEAVQSYPEAGSFLLLTSTAPVSTVVSPKKPLFKNFFLSIQVFFFLFDEKLMINLR